MLEVGFLFAFLGRQLGRVLSVAFNWATIVLFGRVPRDRELYLSGMAAAAVAWPVVLAGIAFPSFATFLFGLVTVPEWLHFWVRLAMLALAIVLPLAVGWLSSRLPEKTQRPRGRALLMTTLRGFPNAIALFVVIVWMMVVAPIGKLIAFARRWDSVHVPIAVKPSAYETVVADLEAALAREGIATRRRRAPWAYELPGKILRALGGETVRSLVPAVLWQLVDRDFEMTLHPMDLAPLGKTRTLARARAAIVRELTFTEAYQTWSKDAQAIEDRIAKASRGEDDIDAIGAALKRADLDFDEWEILYRLLLQVRLRLSPTESDEMDKREGAVPALRERVAAAVRALAGQRDGR